jgi:hypothetical protein
MNEMGPVMILVRNRARVFCLCYMARRVAAALAWMISVAYQVTHDAQDAFVVLSAVAEDGTSRMA